VSGSIYRITRKDQPKLQKPRIDFSSIEGLVDALANPAVNVRSHAAAQLVARGEKAFGKVNDFLEANEKERHLRARAIWVLAQLGKRGRAKVVEYLTAQDDAEKPLVAYRALRHADPSGTLVRAKALAGSKFLSVRREVAVSLRDVAYDKCKSVIGELIGAYDGRNRYYLEALGVAFTNKEKEIYKDLVAHRFPNPKKWSRTGKRLAWRLHTPESIRDLDACIRSQVPPVDEFRFLAMAFASFKNDEERKERKERLLAIGKLKDFQLEHYQVSVREIVEKDLNNLEGELMTNNYPVPKDLGEPTKVSTPAEIAKLKGDPEKGKALMGKCYICHKIEGAGVPFGPELTHWGKQRTIEQIVYEIVSPDAKLAHGYEKPIRVRGQNNIAEGFLSNYSHHAGSLKVKVMGGETRKILFRQAGAKIDYLKASWMPSASELGLTDQDVCNVAHFLKQTGSEGNPPQEGIEESVPPKGHEPGWEVLTGDDFVNVNCHADTWTWQLGHAFCTGKPTGVIRYREPLKNFELLCEWMHKKKGGNSGVFVWATPQSIGKLASGQGRLPKGIEVQVLDLGYAEVYKARHKKPADWFTSHGDVFPVGPIKMRPFPPVAPNGRRSFPSKETTKGINEWNHYYVKAKDGEVRLWVNGEEVSGGDNISPSSGYLCLESEGAPVEFRNIRLRKLSSSLKEETIPIVKPQPAIDLKGHPTLGKWYYGGHSREITEDGMVTLREGNNIQWKRRCISKTKDGFVLEGNLTHQLKGDMLNIENRYKAKRK
jgi:putative heme-binding domain-containing protein